MTKLWPEGVPLQVIRDADETPQTFLWRGRWHTVAEIGLRWRVEVDWWAAEVRRDYVKLTTAEGLLCTLYRDLHTGQWFWARLYD
jgi:hypothetical protein